MTVQIAAGGRFTGFTRTIKRLNQRMKAAESYLAMRAQAAGMPAARILVRAGLLSAALTLLLGVLLVAFWIFLAIAPALLFALIIYARAATGLVGDTHEDSGPNAMSADLYVGDHDENGHYIGYYKTTKFERGPLDD